MRSFSSRMVLSALAAAAMVPLMGVAVGTAVLVNTGEAQASPIPNCNFRSLGQPAGRRGETVTWQVRLTNAHGHPVANVPVAFTWRSAARGAQTLPAGFTDANGVATLRFRIPTNPADDNIILTGITGGGRFTRIAEQRVAIGR